MQLLDSEDEILVGNAALCLGNCMEVPHAASSLLSTDIVPILLKLAGSDAQQTAVQLNAGIALGKLCTAEPRCAGPREAQLLLCRKSAPTAPTRPGHWGALRLKPARGHSMGQGSFLAPAAIVFSLLSSCSLLFPLLLPLLPPAPPLSPIILSPLLFQKQASNFIFFFFRLGPKRMEECPVGYVLEKTGNLGAGGQPDEERPTSQARSLCVTVPVSARFPLHSVLI